MMHIRVNNFLCLKYLLDFCPFCLGNNFNPQPLSIHPSISSNTVICNNYWPTIATVVVGPSINLLYGVFAKGCIEILALNIKCIPEYSTPTI